jgi:hypothetical protein
MSDAPISLTTSSSPPLSCYCAPDATGDIDMITKAE